MNRRLVIWEVLPFLGGGQRVALQIADALRSDFECHFLVPDEGPLASEVRRRGFSCSALQLGSYTAGIKGGSDVLRFAWRTPGVVLRAVRELQRKPASLLYVNGATAFLWSAVVGTVTGTPVIWHVHNWFADRKSVALLQLFGRLPAVKRVVFVSEFVRSQFPSLAKKAAVIYNGIDPAGFRNGFCSAVRAELQLPQSAPVIGIIGALMPQKGQDIFLRSVPYVLKESPQARFLVVGGTWPGAEQFASSLHSLVGELGIADEVLFTGHRNDVPCLLSAFDATVLCSIEACPLTLLESCAAGVPVVGPDRGGTAELITKGSIGETYEYGDARALAIGIVRVLGWQRSEASEACLAFTEQHTLRAFAAQLRCAVGSCCSDNGPVSN